MEKLKNYAKKILKNAKLTLTLIVLFGLALRLIFFSGMGASDDLAYSKYAYNVNRGIEPDSVLTLATRIGIIYTTAFSYRTFGVNDVSSVLFVLLTSIGNIVLAYYFGKLLSNKKVGMVSAFLMSFFPLEVVYATKLLTDIPSAFFMALGVYFFLYAESISKSKFNYLTSGIFLGIGYLIRESALLIGLFFLIYVVFNKKVKNEYFFVVMGFVLLFAVELIVFYRLTGNPLFRYTAVQDYLLQAHTQYNNFGRLIMPQGLFHYPYVILTNPLISSFYVLIFTAIAYFVFLKKEDAKKIYLLLFWFIPLLLYLSFGSSSFSHYVPFKADPRYLSVITVPGILLLANFLAEKKSFIKRFVTSFILIVLLIISIVYVYWHNNRNVLGDLRELHAYLEKSNYKEVFTDKRSMQALEYISEYKNELNIKEYPQDLSAIRNTYLVINQDMIRKLKAVNQNFPEGIDNPPKRWVVVKEIGKSKDNKIIVYRIQ